MTCSQGSKGSVFWHLSNKKLVPATVLWICLISPCKINTGLERKVGDKVVGWRLVEMLLSKKPFPSVICPWIWVMLKGTGRLRRLSTLGCPGASVAHCAWCRGKVEQIRPRGQEIHTWFEGSMRVFECLTWFVKLHTRIGSLDRIWKFCTSCTSCKMLWLICKNCCWVCSNCCSCCCLSCAMLVSVCWCTEQMHQGIDFPLLHLRLAPEQACWPRRVSRGL